MIAAIIIIAVSIAAMICIVLVKPSVKIKNFSLGLYWVVVLVGAVLLLACGLVDARYVGERLIANDAINPLKILVLFISMTTLSVFLDEIGFFKYVANAALKRAGTNQFRLFIYVYLIVSVLTVFTSNDIIILTFTPFICYFAANARIKPLPYLIAEFVAANTWSMFLIIGNPTNVYLATANGIDFATYLSVMALPTVFGGLVSFGIMLLVFGKSLREPLSPVIEDVLIEDKGLLGIGLFHLVACTVLLAISSYIGLEMWYVTLAFAVSLAVCTLIYKAFRRQKPVELWHCIKRAPWELLPFVLSMFIFVLTFEQYGITEKIGLLFGTENVLWSYGFGSLLVSNLINNIPMSVLFSSIAQTLEGTSRALAVYATVVGSNVGAFLTPVGALAGIMWSQILKEHNLKVGFLTFSKYGIITAVPTLAATLGGLALMSCIIPL